MSMLDHALEWAAKGRPVFPCNPSADPRFAKKPLTANGHRDATTDPRQIQEWWVKSPNALIGVPPGPKSGFWVLDVDRDETKGLDGFASLAELEAINGPLPVTTTCV